MALLQRWPPLTIPGVLLLLVTLLLWLLLRSPQPLQLDVGVDADTRFLSGFYLVERHYGRSFRWSGPEARMVLHGASSGPNLLRLSLNGEQLAAQADPTLTLMQETTPVVRFAVTEGWRHYAVVLPPGVAAQARGVAQPLDLHSTLVRPGQRPADLDLRLLGVPLAEVSLTPLPGSNHAALSRSLALGWLLAVLVAALIWVVTLLRAYQTPLLAAAASLLIALVGSALLLWAWYDPYSLVWMLPPTPWLLGTATLLLLLAWRGAAARRGDEVHGQRENGFIAAKERKATQANSGACAPLPQRGRGVGGEGHPRHPKTQSVDSGIDVLYAHEGGKALAWLTTPWPVLVGLGLLALAGGMLATQLPFAVGAGIAVALGALLLLTAGPQGLGNNLWQPSGPDFSRQHALLLLTLIFILALALRLFRLDEMPFGLWRDEARHGLFAQRIRDFSGYRPIYIASERVNMPALGLYPFALALYLWGEQLWSMRLVTAVAGALTVFPLYALAALLSGQRAVGLVAALLLAASSWHITISRFSFPTVFDPLLALSGLVLLLVGLYWGGEEARRRGGEDTRRRGGEDARRHPASRISHLASRFPLPAFLLTLIAAGGLLGLAVQTYHTGRVAPLVAAWLGFLLLCFYPHAWRRLLGGAIAIILGLLLTLGPLFSYALNQPEAFNDRVGAVFLLSPEILRAEAPLVALDDALRRHLLMFHVLGDENGRHHAPRHPMLDYVSGIGMLLGLAALLRWWRDWRTLFIFGGLGLGLLPSALAMNAPHGMRAFAAIGFVYIIVALGWVALWRSLWARCNRLRPQLVRGLAVGLLSLSVALNVHLYFVVMPPQVGVYLVFYPVQSQMGSYVRSLADEDRLPPQIFVGDGLPQDPVFAFLTTGIPVATFAGAQLSTPAEAGALFLLSGYFVQEDLAALASILGPDPEPVVMGPLFPDGSRRTFYGYRLP
ncbi:phospholipid carrier-dependent glycosyltransferase [Candidatus Viridilinea mediisalina]|uniref:ArnT-like N-terminal domain-containing protein n=1 Tax=Candidatus Viridilinea mediisalina TaxID=2024553 RepID=A0A2A6RNN1_9CHLR|nr:glycosyltransferase family 39 protein [Candidatus Viridilinea mediisalina]PDW04714.1 hypothetical protein CJ255_02115 [Candidatus Viridilinea mediisalina]